ncbi:LYR motif-containing protein 5 [Rhodotorula kratochvilovae]
MVARNLVGDVVPPALPPPTATLSLRRRADSPKLSSLPQLRLRARALYKELYHLGKEYPDPTYGIHARLHRCFLAHVGAERDKVKEGIKKAEFIKAELEAMYSLRKYRAMKQRYYDEAPRNTE